MLQHKHLMVSAEVTSPPKDTEELNAFLTLLIKRIGMNIAVDDDLKQNPQSYYCDKNGNRGMTGIAILETSNCAIHTWEETSPAKFEFDLYSCAHFEKEDVIDLIDIFKIVKYDYILIDRQDGLTLIEKGNQDGNEETGQTA
jgi:S-adenosylmethionine/arginine decarboxylase-like enzyme